MKKNIFILAFAFICSLTAYSQPGAQNIRFTAKPNAVNGLDIYAKNVSGADISGSIGGATLTLCVLVPTSINPQPTVSISSTISGLTNAATAFGPVVTPLDNITISSINYTVYTFNGSATSASVDFPVNTEVLIATYSFTGIPFTTSTVLLGMLPAGGGSGFDYCYIAPNGIDETDYANPFYSDIPSDAGLHNANGPNDLSNNSLSYLAVANVTLPVKFTGFSATKKDDDGILNWAVVNEAPTTGSYEVERSLDGINFTTIATVATKGNGDYTSNTYNYSDDNLSSLNAATIFYRIEQVDEDGSAAYTDIKTVSLSSGVVVKTYPNPVKDNVSVSVGLPEASNVSIDITDASGKQLQLVQLAGAKGTNLSNISLAGYASGSYLIKVTSDSGTTTIPVVKE
jgi:hypothetical protein